MKSFKTAKVLRRNWELLMIPSRFCTKTSLKSLNLTVPNGLVKISAKFNFVGTYFNAILCLLDRTSPQNLMRISMCLVRFECVGLFRSMCIAGSLSVWSTVFLSMFGKPSSSSTGCSHNSSLHTSVT